ncbi:venom factor isoform X1 [Lingula anatina]|uniref:Venom factor isoform X1 n=1 Tax=Lingula anatina TaxID=7574 RepID=A0A1S3KD07_LINAN|nr:venom factor isoform X1 [Lingula anatina]XP_013420337.1 venom factor isoform X1 [Lingula anatina]XP_013420338.1 venom factor isoform X1 [Lingula anatina]XP_013420339.1 venom factor isoform X1 [Lingula anatina]|eukprot:XP_013420336.1 venom factor isoform X1 [Lingula anatina]
MLLQILLLVLGWCYGQGQQSPSYFIAAPDVFRLGVEETVSVTLSHVLGPVNVKIYLQDYPDRRTTFSVAEGMFRDGIPGELTIKVNSNDLPMSTAPKRYVYLVAKSESPSIQFQKEIPVLVSPRTGYVFIQTDKPIYTPKQEVKMRVVYLNQDMKPTSDPIQIDIMNPQRTVVERYTNVTVKEGFISLTFTFPPFPMFGNWTVAAYYGLDHLQNTSVKFEVKEYVLPTFSVKVISRPYILPHDVLIHGKVTAKYVYGKGVKGSVFMKFGIMNYEGEVIVFGTQKHLQMVNGEVSWEVSTQYIRDLGEDFWFPDGARFYIHAEVTERATGKKEIKEDSSAQFVRSPYYLDFKRTNRYFKPGLPFDAKVDLFYANHTRASSVQVSLSAFAILTDWSQVAVEMMDNGPTTVETDDHGQAQFTVLVPPNTDTLALTVKTSDMSPSANLTQVTTAYHSPSKQYMVVRVKERQINVGDSIAAEAFLTTDQNVNIQYMVIAGGKITEQRSVAKMEGGMTFLPFIVSHDMLPAARLVAHYIDQTTGEVVADSVWFDIEDECRNKILLTTDQKDYHPGQHGKVVVKGEPKSKVGLLAVDKAVYLLNANDRLTPQKMFSAMESYDLGCTPGGGQDSRTVFKDAGIAVIMSADLYVDKRTDIKCDVLPTHRKKRAIRRSRLDNWNVQDEKTRCCNLGQRRDFSGLTCYQRIAGLRNVTNHCRATFFRCCKEMPVQERIGRLSAYMVYAKPDDFRGRSSDIIPEPLQLTFDQIPVDESGVPVRSDFPESWLFEDIYLDDYGQASHSVNFPDSITTWVVHGLGIGARDGLCVTRAHNVTVFKSFFLQLELPYSAIKGEQIEVMATVYNYERVEMRVKMFMDGTEGVCASSLPGTKSQEKMFVVAPGDAYSVSYPIVPLEAGEYPIKVKAFTSFGPDIVEKKLLVVPEGIEKVKSYSVILDPAGRLSRFKRSSRDTDQRQTNIVDARPPEEAIEGTEKCTVSALGSVVGPSVSSYINGIEEFMVMPKGCGEQTMIYMAPTLYATYYLKKTGQLTPEVEKKALNFITEGYKRELTFRKEDGSFSAWTHYPASTWLTAFVVKNFCRAKEYVYIDDNVICSGIKWLLKNQHANGVFFESGEVVHKEMTGGLHGDASLTAFVSIALSECKQYCKNEDVTLAQRKATSYLETRISGPIRPFTISIISYALALAGSSQKDRANRKLRILSRFDPGMGVSVKNHRYWEVDTYSRYEGDYIPYQYKHNPSAIAVETASYALLTQMLSEDITFSNPVVMWLTEQRGKKGEFVSTQDTVVALHALAEYAAKTHSSTVDLQCEVHSDVDTTYEKEIRIKRENAEVLQEVVAPTGGQLTISTVGSGVGMMSVEMRYNVPTTKGEICRFNLTVNSKEKNLLDDHMANGASVGPQGLTPADLPAVQPRRAELVFGSIPEFPLPGEIPMDLPEVQPRIAISSPTRRRKSHLESYSFGPQARSRPTVRRSRFGGPREEPQVFLRAEPQARSGVSSYVTEIHACARYLVPGKKSGMTILEVGLYTGFQAVTEDLNELVKKENTKVQRYEIADRAVIFYLKEVDHAEDYCIKFDAIQIHRVGRTQPVAVKIYDYYETSETCTEFYHPKKGSPLLKVQCEGGQCICAEGNCGKCYTHTPRDSFQYTISFNKMRRKLCGRGSEKPMDFALKAKVISIDEMNSLVNITVVVKKVIKQGIEQVSKDMNLTFFKRKACNCPHFEIHKSYLIMGRDGRRYTDKFGQTKYKYYIDDRSFVVEWLDRGRTSKERRLSQYLRRISRTTCRK